MAKSNILFNELLKIIEKNEETFIAVDLSNQQLDCEDVIKLCLALKKNSYICSVNLSENKINGKIFFQYIVSHLYRRNSITHLDLSNNNICEVGYNRKFEKRVKQFFEEKNVILTGCPLLDILFTERKITYQIPTEYRTVPISREVYESVGFGAVRKFRTEYVKVPCNYKQVEKIENECLNPKRDALKKLIGTAQKSNSFLKLEINNNALLQLVPSHQDMLNELKHAISLLTQKNPKDSARYKNYCNQINSSKDLITLLINLLNLFTESKNEPGFFAQFQEKNDWKNGLMPQLESYLRAFFEIPFQNNQHDCQLKEQAIQLVEKILLKENLITPENLYLENTNNEIHDGMHHSRHPNYGYISINS